MAEGALVCIRSRSALVTDSVSSFVSSGRERFQNLVRGSVWSITLYHSINRVVDRHYDFPAVFPIDPYFVFCFRIFFR